MISSICWVPKGVAKAVPESAPLTEEELAALKEEAAQRAAGVLAGEEEEEQADEDDSDNNADESEEEWNTEDEDGPGSSGDGGMEDDGDAAVAKARAFASALATSSSAAAAAKGKKGSTAGGKKAPMHSLTLEQQLAELDMEHYDDDDDGDAPGADGLDEETRIAVVSRALGGGAELAFRGRDPYLSRATAGGDSDNDDDEDDEEDGEERDDYVIRPDDLLLLAARSEDDVSTLEVWLYEEGGASTGGEANVYVHHDILLPALPLCVAWLDVAPGGGASAARRNFAAVGGMEPGIELWDLDLVDQVEPAATLGGYEPAGASGAGDDGEEDSDAGGAALGRAEKKKAAAKARKKAKKKGKGGKKAAAPALRAGSHAGAVLSLSWNGVFRNVLASGGADSAVKVWDVAAAACTSTLGHHGDKVQALAWNPAEPPVLLTGSFDRTAALADVRAPDAAAAAAKWKLSADVEALAWNPGAPTSFVVSTEDGLVAAFDARGGAGSKPLFRLSAHTKPACALSFCAAAPGLLATAGTDKTAKLWDVSAGAPALLASCEPKLGAIFTASFCGPADAPHLLAMAGAKGAVGVWDVRAAAKVAARWPGLMRDAPPPTPEQQRSARP